MTAPGRIILLNGVGSVGKSSIAKALQRITAAPFLHVSMDDFLDMMPPSLFEAPDGMVFTPREVDGKPSVEITVGPAAEHALRGMRAAMAAMARAGNNLIIDDVLIGNDAAEYAEALAGLQVDWVGVFAPPRRAGGTRAQARRPRYRPGALAVRPCASRHPLRPGDRHQLRRSGEMRAADQGGVRSVKSRLKSARFVNPTRA
jgi:chloramphenicol 3-O phosphotransferase